MPESAASGFYVGGLESLVAHLWSVDIPASMGDLTVQSIGFDARIRKRLWSVAYQGSVVGFLDGPL